MEEIKLKEPEELPFIYSERIKSIDPDIPTKKRGFSLYMFITLLAFAFVTLFSFSDFFYRSFFCEDENSEIKISEVVSGRLLGISRDRLSAIQAFKPNDFSDEQYGQNGNQEEKDPIADGTDRETTTEAIDSAEETEPQSNTDTESPQSEGKKYPVILMDLSQKQLGEYYIGNETGYTPDIKSLMTAETSMPDFTETDEPYVLIIHTHGTESYLPEGTDYYIDGEGDIARTSDTSKNVVYIGKVMADILNAEGIKTLHCEIMHDEESYQDSYSRAADTIKSYIAKYPSIKYVFDVHRDAIMKSDGSLVKAATEIDGESVAQVMTVVGSNYKGADFPDWEEHLSIALKLKNELDKKYDSLSRPVYLRGAAYNQQYTPGSLLLEIGSSGNTLSEAERAAKIVAKTIADMILS